jgi:hypothetical protein
MSSRPACRASPAGADEKSSLNLDIQPPVTFEVQSCLPPLSFGPSAAIVSGSATECLTSLADDMPTMPLLTSALRSGRLSAPSVAETTQSRSPRISSVAFGAWPARPTLAPSARSLSVDSHVCYTLPSDFASRRQPLRFR